MFTKTNTINLFIINFHKYSPLFSLPKHKRLHQNNFFFFFLNQTKVVLKKVSW